MNPVRVAWALSALVWGGIAAVMMIALGWWAVAVGALFLVFPDVALINAFAERGRLRPDRVSFYNTLHRLQYPIVLLVMGVIVFVTTGATQGGFWPIMLAGIAWFVHIAADRAFGFGLRDAEGNVIPVGD